MHNATCGSAALEMPAFAQDHGGTVSNRPHTSFWPPNCHRLTLLESSVCQIVGMSSLTTNYTTDCTGDSLGEVKCLPVLDGQFCCSVEAFDRVPVDSIMYSLTTHQARPCLSQDDLDGLNHLYPSCSHARLEDPICIKSSRNIGYARIGLCAADPSLLPPHPHTIPRLHNFLPQLNYWFAGTSSSPSRSFHS